ncbi:MAG: MFS transporter [Luteolibacter sp.]
MESEPGKKWLMGRLGLVFFFHGLAPGFWIPALTNMLKAEGLSGWVAVCFAVIPICSLISPVIGGAIADERMPAQKLFGFCSLLAAVFIFLAFGALQMGLGPWWFLLGLVLYALASGPTWGLLATISLTHLENGEKQYPVVRLGGTFGWVLAGFLTSYLLRADASPVVGFAAAGARICAGVMAFTLPNTPPLGLRTSWWSVFGSRGFTIFKNRDHATLLIVTGLFSVPLAAFYMYSPEMFEMLGDKTPTASMTVAQWSEVVVMLSLGALMVKYRLKTLLMWGLGLSAVRFALCGYAGFSGLIGWHYAGVALHGVCYTIYFITAQVYMNRRVEPGLRGQAQGLLNLMAGGIGPLVGTFFCGWLRGVCVDENGEGWEVFWWTLAGMVAFCWGLFAVFYRGLPKPVHRPA